MDGSAVRFGRVLLALLAIVSGWLCVGCATAPNFPRPLDVQVNQDQTVLTFDTDRDGHADYWQYQRADGRKVALAFAAERSDRPGPRIELDAIGAGDCPHLVIVLDGVPFELVEQLYCEGCFRLFYPPSRVVCCFPSMTDLALTEMFHSGRCLGYQALYFDRAANRLSDGDQVYLSGRNSPWLSRMNYRCSLWWDVLVYLDPGAVFRHEIDGIRRAFRTVRDGQFYAYSVGTAGLGTRGGRAAILDYLRTIDRLCEQIVCERQGRVKITVTADHGHNLVANRRLDLSEILRAGGYRPSRSLHGPRDVVVVSYGLVTYAELHARDPAGVAACLVDHEDVELACYPADGGVVVMDRHGRARITKGLAGFVYDSSQGDPLDLDSIVQRLRQAGKVSADGQIDGTALFHATLDHSYPDPLTRIWGAFHDLVENPPDVIVNLRDGACHGSGFFQTMIGKVSSTHGSLNRLNSTTFALTMLGELPPAMRPADVLPALERPQSEHGSGR
jgi:hypothetical protein